MPDDEPSPMSTSPLSTRRYVESDRVEGTVVYDVRGHRVGEVKRLIIEKVSGHVAFVIIAFEGFFGLGAENHALAWNKLHYDQELGGYRTEVTEDELKAAPDFPARSDADEHRQDDRGFQAYYRIPPSGRAI
jgi:sporulation protein YlmC with PRC-barrel domain